jgi:hypothetical protein
VLLLPWVPIQLGIVREVGPPCHVAGCLDGCRGELAHVLLHVEIEGVGGGCVDHDDVGIMHLIAAIADVPPFMAMKLR